MKLKYAMVCSSNQNRSMEAHFLLKKQGFDVSSYGTGAMLSFLDPLLGILMYMTLVLLISKCSMSFVVKTLICTSAMAYCQC
ncbi:RNA polymerase II subunit A C-terminal domain phosphatase SSU72 [Bienertia sinuspersici]